MASNNEDVLLNLELQIEDDKTAFIQIKDDDDIEEVVNHFCSSNNYNEDIKNVIMTQLIEALSKNIDKSKLLFIYL
jgi:hypothetical protein